MKSLIKLIIALFLLSYLLSSCRAITDKVLSLDNGERLLYLVAGFDEAAENTDVLFTVGIDKAEKTLYIAQIPRDTYYNFGSGQNKINQYFAHLRAAGLDKAEAMEKTASAISGLFGAELSGYIGIGIGTFRNIVDSLGGVSIYLKDDVTLQSESGGIELRAGENLIDGAAAEVLVRHRSGYARGDLGRIDVQKLFLSALISRIASGASPAELIGIAKSLSGEVVTDMDLLEIARLVISNFELSEDAAAYFVTVPGEAAEDSRGLSYYVLNKRGAGQIAKKYMFSSGEFDEYRLCLNTDEAGFQNIYDDTSISAREFSSEDASEIRIPVS